MKQKILRAIDYTIAILVLFLSEWCGFDTMHRITDDPSWLLWMAFFFVIGPGIAYCVLAIIVKAMDTVTEMLNDKPKA